MLTTRVRQTSEVSANQLPHHEVSSKLGWSQQVHQGLQLHSARDAEPRSLIGISALASRFQEFFGHVQVANNACGIQGFGEGGEGWLHSNGPGEEKSWACLAAYQPQQSSWSHIYKATRTHYRRKSTPVMASSTSRQIPKSWQTSDKKRAQRTGIA